MGYFGAIKAPHGDLLQYPSTTRASHYSDSTTTHSSDLVRSMHRF
jgi:hypothetical protein